MADITKCSNYTCNIRHTCYRWTAKASEWQSWQNFNQKNCTHFIKIST